MKLLYSLIGLCFSYGVDRETANGFLSRKPRWGFGLEELQEGDLERECIEETCTKSENFECFDHDERHNESWSKINGCWTMLELKKQVMNPTAVRNCYSNDDRTLPPEK
ncbi:Oidioi.mRNA.OKI2018_I69.chr1.g1186.t1.cds [Oikopleura dioica]|uniref:Oidioi.mRNA.OKI2018_I69.chr1.g1186.t1.cds n=1 Tax=Oikopleura dioica TaxID=34765 RepID=A0ABN7SS67_OIKDI|nr:Oidioi.mRNA.OKI2018_I69.chr1.g1186.t1.cds [Oikopleura dioica]